ARPLCLPQGCADAAAHAQGQPGEGIAAASLAGCNRLISSRETGDGQHGIAAPLRCKSRCELLTVSKVKRNCVRVTERREEAWSVNPEPMIKNRIEGAAMQGEGASNRKALVTTAGWRRCGGECDEGVRSYLGRSRLMPERATAMPLREVSRGRSSHSRGR
ncbi:MAG: 50S ribosomal protein L17-like protein, partial [uncultured bacterium]